ncbi:MAG: pantoate--beta-alanine ligase [Myxococcales bacterium]|nr:pantoate--beta-alanine ligase [Myxococcales bacterium]
MRASSLRVVRTPDELRAACDGARARGERVGFVPTMGALHEGHLALVHEASRRSGFVVASIFVNPTQFGPTEDFARYPRDLGADCKKLEGSVDVVFAPEQGAMYPGGDETRVRVTETAAHLCGRFRPVHFEGVCTVVAKLFGLVGSCTAVFGRKDYQQLAVIRRLVRDLFLPVEVIGHPIVREPDGLALSSRHAYLSAEERARALCLARGLSAAVAAFEAGELDAAAVRARARAEVERGADRVDYVEVADADRVVPLEDGAKIEGRALVAIACHVGKTRLIDNVVLGEDPAPLGLIA